MSKDHKTAVTRALDDLKADVVHVGLFDYAAMFRERRLRRDDFLATLDTAVFANVPPKWDSAETIFAAGPYRSERIAVDAASIRPYPFEANAAAAVADYIGPQQDIMPRAVLKRQLAKAESMGFTAEAAFEFEFIVLAETADTLRSKGFVDAALFAADNRCWSGQTAATFAPFVSDLETLLGKGGIDLYSLSGELGPGCFEATLRHQPALRAADDAAFFRSFTKSFCRRRDLTASFMAMLGTGFPGIGGHVTISLKDAEGENVFAAPEAEHGLSKTARAFLAGMIAGVPEGFPLCNHTVNDYRRLAPGSWAPKTMSWAPYNYAAAVRTAAETPAMTRLEFRLPGADCNPFLSLALVLATGLDGLERGLELTSAPITSGGPGEIPEGVPRLPLDLASATATFRASANARAWFGDAFVDHFATVCEVEDAALRRAVSAEEVRRYLEG